MWHLQFYLLYKNCHWHLAQTSSFLGFDASVSQQDKSIYIVLHEQADGSLVLSLQRTERRCRQKWFGFLKGSHPPWRIGSIETARTGIRMHTWCTAIQPKMNLPYLSFRPRRNAHVLRPGRPGNLWQIVSQLNIQAGSVLAVCLPFEFILVFAKAAAKKVENNSSFFASWTATPLFPPYKRMWAETNGPQQDSKNERTLLHRIHLIKRNCSVTPR